MSISPRVIGILGVGVEADASPSIPIPRLSLWVLGAPAVSLGTEKASMIGVTGGASDPCGRRVREGEDGLLCRRVGSERATWRRPAVSQVDALLLAVWAAASLCTRRWEYWDTCDGLGEGWPPRSWLLHTLS